jgi:hypothetical protein
LGGWIKNHRFFFWPLRIIVEPNGGNVEAGRAETGLWLGYLSYLAIASLLTFGHLVGRSLG